MKSLMRRASVLLFSLWCASILLLTVASVPASAHSLAGATGMMRFVHAAGGIAPAATGTMTTTPTPAAGTMTTTPTPTPATGTTTTSGMTTTPQGTTGTQGTTTPAVPMNIAGAPGPVDIFLDGQFPAVATQVAFGGASQYLSLAAGPHQVQIAPAGKGVAAAVTTQMLTVTAGVSQTAALVGGTATIPFALKVFTDNNTAPATTTTNATTMGMAQLRVYHLAPTQGTVNMNVNNTAVVIGLQTLMASRYHTVAAGQSTFQVTSQATGQALPVMTVTQAGQMQQLTMTLLPNTINSIFLVDAPTAMMTNGTMTTTTMMAGTSTVMATPAMPMTGSDPAGQESTSLLITIGVLLILGGLLFFTRTTKRSTQAK